MAVTTRHAAFRACEFVVQLRVDMVVFRGDYPWSKNLRAIAPWVAAPPARSAAASSADSTTSARLAPAALAALACTSRQYGHWVVHATASAISSRYFFGMAPPSRPTMLSRPSQASKSAGDSLRISLRK